VRTERAAGVSKKKRSDGKRGRAARRTGVTAWPRYLSLWSEDEEISWLGRQRPEVAGRSRRARSAAERTAAHRPAEALAACSASSQSGPPAVRGERGDLRPASAVRRSVSGKVTPRVECTASTPAALSATTLPPPQSGSEPRPGRNPGDGGRSRGSAGLRSRGGDGELRSDPRDLEAACIRGVYKTLYLSNALAAR